jgi:hypothetical protein
MHLGMTGMVQVSPGIQTNDHADHNIQLKGKEPTWYVRRPRDRVMTWPPRVRGICTHTSN